MLGRDKFLWNIFKLVDGHNNLIKCWRIAWIAKLHPENINDRVWQPLRTKLEPQAQTVREQQSPRPHLCRWHAPTCYTPSRPDGIFGKDTGNVTGRALLKRAASYSSRRQRKAFVLSNQPFNRNPFERSILASEAYRGERKFHAHPCRAAALIAL
jgi:hypothetical protein